MLHPVMFYGGIRRINVDYKWPFTKNWKSGNIMDIKMYFLEKYLL